MNGYLAWQALSILWTIIAVYLGGLWTVLGAASVFRNEEQEGPSLSWWLVPAGLILITSASVALTLAFGRTASFDDVVRESVIGVVGFALALVVLILVILWSRRTDRGWRHVIDGVGPRLVVLLRVILITGTAAAAAAAQNPGERVALALFACFQLILLVIAVWLRRDFRKRTA